jgi:hypothetical protein
VNVEFEPIIPLSIHRAEVFPHELAAEQIGHQRANFINHIHLKRQRAGKKLPSPTWMEHLSKLCRSLREKQSSVW